MSDNNDQKLQKANIQEGKFKYWLITIITFCIVFVLSMRILLSYFAYNENIFPISQWFFFPSQVTYNIFDFPSKYLIKGDNGPNSNVEYFNSTDSLMYHFRLKTSWIKQNSPEYLQIRDRYFPEYQIDDTYFIECHEYVEDVLNTEESKNKYFTSYIAQYVTITKYFYVIAIFLVSYFIAIIVKRAYRLNSKSNRFVICPYCDKSVLTYYNWRCDHCNHQQGEYSYIFDPCNQCGRKLEILICEHCEKEFKF